MQLLFCWLGHVVIEFVDEEIRVVLVDIVVVRVEADVSEVIEVGWMK
jgi:hypothetical protein